MPTVHSPQIHLKLAGNNHTEVDVNIKTTEQQHFFERIWNKIKDWFSGTERSVAMEYFTDFTKSKGLDETLTGFDGMKKYCSENFQDKFTIKLDIQQNKVNFSIENQPIKSFSFNELRADKVNIDKLINALDSDQDKEFLLAYVQRGKSTDPLNNTNNHHPSNMESSAINANEIIFQEHQIVKPATIIPHSSAEQEAEVPQTFLMNENAQSRLKLALNNTSIATQAIVQLPPLSNAKTNDNMALIEPSTLTSPKSAAVNHSSSHQVKQEVLNNILDHMKTQGYSPENIGILSKLIQGENVAKYVDQLNSNGGHYFFSYNIKETLDGYDVTAVDRVNKGQTTTLISHHYDKPLMRSSEFIENNLNNINNRMKSNEVFTFHDKQTYRKQMQNLREESTLLTATEKRTQLLTLMTNPEERCLLANAYLGLGTREQVKHIALFDEFYNVKRNIEDGLQTHLTQTKATDNGVVSVIYNKDKSNIPILNFPAFRSDYDIDPNTPDSADMFNLYQKGKEASWNYGFLLSRLVQNVHCTALIDDIELEKLHTDKQLHQMKDTLVSLANKYNYPLELTIKRIDNNQKFNDITIQTVTQQQNLTHVKKEVNLSEWLAKMIFADEKFDETNVNDLLENMNALQEHINIYQIKMGAVINDLDTHTLSSIPMNENRYILVAKDDAALAHIQEYFTYDSDSDSDSDYDSDSDSDSDGDGDGE